jgi:hypothetical protein
MPSVTQLAPTVKTKSGYTSDRRGFGQHKYKLLLLSERLPQPSLQFKRYFDTPLYLLGNGPLQALQPDYPECLPRGESIKRLSLSLKTWCNPAQSRYNPGKDSNIPNVEKLGEK